MARVEKIAGLRTILTGGSDSNGGGADNDPVVCLLHGYGANGEDLAGLWRALKVPPQTRFAFPEAPISLSGMFGFPAYCWWHIDVGRFVEAASTGLGLEQLFDEEPDGLPEVRARLLRFLDELAALLKVERSRIVLGGFSQGAMLSVDVALHLPGTVSLAGLALLSGALINRKQWQPRLAQALPAPRFQSHGSVDDILPFNAGLALHQLLSQGPFPGELRRFHGRHEIPPVIIDNLGAWLTKLLSVHNK